ncbi:hypothetical protein K402DRAFT_223604 [Aulographum hederae CBS 113979]|uniref:Uncharacterized protein n=1 Tax=Aulographum hederae CBS 113979 TaxID=1176131 RepID=A0A6G1GLQ5_9PEZI|nr:hypothetical protein K402DRAFT_223604 [Aulographum hederae CBS 113979]
MKTGLLCAALIVAFGLRIVTAAPSTSSKNNVLEARQNDVPACKKGTNGPPGKTYYDLGECNDTCFGTETDGGSGVCRGKCEVTFCQRCLEAWRCHVD